MNTKLQALEQTLSELLKHRSDSSARNLFNLGIEFGKELSTQKITDYESTSWKKIDNIENDKTSIQKIVHDIYRIFALILRLSIKENLQDSHYWEISKSNQQKFSNETVSKYCIQFRETRFDELETEFNTYFDISGQLATLLKSYGFYNSFVLHTYANTRNDVIYLDPDEVTLHSLDNLSLQRNDSNCDLEQFKALYNEIHKLYAFEILKHSEWFANQ